MSSRKAVATTARTARRAALRLSLTVLATAVLGLGATNVAAQVPALPKSPVTLNIVDVAGNLALTQDAIEAYQKSHSTLLAKVNFTKAPAPELEPDPPGS